MNNSPDNYFKTITCSMLHLLAYIYSIWFIYNLALGIFSVSWEETQGKIIQNRVTSGEIVLVLGKRYGNSSERIPDLHREFVYEYNVNGRIYHSSRISYFNREYTPNEYGDLTVFYCKWLPSFTVLDRGLQISGPMIIINASLLILALFFWYLNYTSS